MQLLPVRLQLSVWEKRCTGSEWRITLTSLRQRIWSTAKNRAGGVNETYFGVLRGEPGPIWCFDTHSKPCFFMPVSCLSVSLSECCCCCYVLCLTRLAVRGIAVYKRLTCRKAMFGMIQPNYLLHCLRPQANYTDRATAACRRSLCQLLRIEGATWSPWQIPTTVFSDF
jgi:hypothetical protein